MNEFLDCNQELGSVFRVIREKLVARFEHLSIWKSHSLIPQTPSKSQKIITHLFSTDKGQTGTINSVVIVCYQFFDRFTTLCRCMLSFELIPYFHLKFFVVLLFLLRPVNMKMSEH